jgi:hypothetical protein
LLGDAKNSLGDAKSSLGDAKSSLGDVKSSLGDAKGQAAPGPPVGTQWGVTQWGHKWGEAPPPSTDVHATRLQGKKRKSVEPLSFRDAVVDAAAAVGGASKSKARWAPPPENFTRTL